MIETRRLVKVFGVRPVLRGVDLRIGSGELVTLIGANGAGKTTFLRILATLSNATSGEVLIAGHAVPKEAEAARAALGVVLHQTLLYDTLTAEENLRFYGRLYGVRDSGARIEVVLKQVNLLMRRNDPVRTFSRGQLQRMALARALLHDPPVLLLDEPYTGLDPQSSAALDGLLRGMLAEGRTILMTIHDLERGLALSTRVAILAQGKIAREVESRSVTTEQLLALYAENAGTVGRAVPVAPAGAVPEAVV